VLTARHAQRIRPNDLGRRRDGARLVGRGASDNILSDASQPQRGLSHYFTVMVQGPTARTSKN
jgi:hypothetical protein